MTTGPEDEDEEEMTLSEAIDQVDETTIAACNEDTYILDRLMRLSRLPQEAVYAVPAELTGRV